MIFFEGARIKIDNSNTFLDVSFVSQTEFIIKTAAISWA